MSRERAVLDAIDRAQRNAASSGDVVNRLQGATVHSSDTIALELSAAHVGAAIALVNMVEALVHRMESIDDKLDTIADHLETIRHTR